MGDRRLTGTLIGLDEKTLTLETESYGKRSIPVESVARLDVSLGPSRRGRGALIGLGVGLVTVRLIPRDDSDFISFSPEVPLILLGTIVGAIVGSEDWKRLPPDSLRLGHGSGEPNRSHVLVALRF
jgi:hypothetical protein